MKNITDLPKDRTALKWGLWTATVLYLIAFPFLLYFSFFIGTMLMGSFPKKISSWLFSLSFLAICLSTPFCIYFMWRSYGKGDYDKAEFFCLAPVIAGLVLLFLF